MTFIGSLRNSLFVTWHEPSVKSFIRLTQKNYINYSKTTKTSFYILTTGTGSQSWWTLPTWSRNVDKTVYCFGCFRVINIVGTNLVCENTGQIRSTFLQTLENTESEHAHTEAQTILTHTHTQPFYGPFSGTTWVSWCQKRTSGLYGARGD